MYECARRMIGGSKELRCRYVFWDANGEIRSPKDRDLARCGEFEQIYRTLPTIEIQFFENGMTPLDPLIIDRVVHLIWGSRIRSLISGLIA